MGLDGVNFGKDYAAKFQAEGQEVLNETRQTLANAGVTVPVGQPVVKTSNLDTPIAGAELEHTEQQPAAAEATEAEQPAEEAPKNKFAASRTITDEASQQQVEDKYRANYLEQRSKGEIGFEGLSDKDIDKLAERAAKDIKRAENEDNTVVYYDKAKYKADKAKLEEAKAQRIEELRKANPEMSKKEAKKQAESEFVELRYLKKGFLGIGGRPRKVVEKFQKDPELAQKFFDENGEFSNEKYHEFTLAMENTNNGDKSIASRVLGLRPLKQSKADYAEQVAMFTEKGVDEDTAKAILAEQGVTEPTTDTVNEKTNHRLSINESELVAKKLSQDGIRVSARQLRALARKGGSSVEKDYDPAIKTGAALALGYAGHMLVPAINIGSSSGAESAADALANSALSAAGASAESAAGANGKVKVRPGALLGLLGLFGHYREKDQIIPELKDYTPKPNVPSTPSEPDTPVVTVPPVQPQPCPTQEWDEKVCTHTVIPGSSWAYYAENSGIKINGKKPAGKYEEAYILAQQLMYNISNPKAMKETRFLPVGAEYVQHSQFDKLFNDEAIMAKYPILNILKNASIDVNNCAELNGKVNGKRNPHYKFGGFVKGQTQIAHNKQACEDNVPVVTYR